MAVGKNGLVTALDVGSTKVCCFIARPDGSGGMRVIGIGHQIAKGMRAGTVRPSNEAADFSAADIQGSDKAILADGHLGFLPFSIFFSRCSWGQANH